MIRLDDLGNLGPQLADLRLLNRLSQRALAEVSNTRQSQISNFELSATRPNLDTLVRLAAALGYDLALIPREGS